MYKKYCILKARVGVMQWSPNGKLLATGSKDCTVIVWNFDPVALKLSHYKVRYCHTVRYGTAIPYRTVLFSSHSWLLCERYLSHCEKDQKKVRVIKFKPANLSGEILFFLEYSDALVELIF
jgi:WD40 repeat protein